VLCCAFNAVRGGRPGAISLDSCYVADRWLIKTYNVGHWLGTLPDISSLPLVGQAYLPTVNLQGEDKFQAVVPGTPGDYFAATFQGRFVVQTAGTYTFCTSSDDGSNLFVDGSLIVDNDGLHGTSQKCVEHH
jgi:hypothetical protein